MSSLGIQKDPIDVARLEQFILDPLVEAALAVVTGLAYLGAAIRKLYQMLKNVDILLHIKHLFTILLT